MDIIEQRHRRLSTGSPEAYVANCTDAELQDKERVARMTRGLHWTPEPERFLAAAASELQWREENNLSYGWSKRVVDVTPEVLDLLNERLEQINDPSDTLVEVEIEVDGVRLRVS